MNAFSSICTCLCTECRRRMLPTKRLMKSSCVETRWRQRIKEQLLTRLRAVVVVAGLQDGPQHLAHHRTSALLGKHQREGLPWVFVKRVSAGNSPPTPTRARLLFFLNLRPPFLHKATKQHTPVRVHTLTHTHALFLSLFSPSSFFFTDVIFHFWPPPFSLSDPCPVHQGILLSRLSNYLETYHI